MESPIAVVCGSVACAGSDVHKSGRAARGARLAWLFIASIARTNEPTAGHTSLGILLGYLAPPPRHCVPLSEAVRYTGLSFRLPSYVHFLVYRGFDLDDLLF